MRPLTLGLSLLAALLPTSSCAKKPLTSLQVPKGFSITLWATAPNARAMCWGAKGTLFVGSRDAGTVYAIVDDGKTRTVKKLATGLLEPAGVAFKDGALYVAEVDKVLRYDDIEAHLDAPPKPVQVLTLPDKRHHGWRDLAFGPDGWLYVTIGAPCNVCQREGEFGTVLRVKPDGTGREVYAKGLRNSVGLAFHPASHQLWLTDNGRDWLGDDQPDDELDVVTKPGDDFGFPFCHAGDVPDPELGAQHPCSDFVPPRAKLGAHVAALGLAFAPPGPFGQDLFIAEHGSWNRSKKSGYQVVRVKLDGGKVGAIEPFVTGFLDGQKPLGRPADVTFAPDGALLISDDETGGIYRVAP